MVVLMAKIKVQAQHLKPGDIVGSGEVVEAVRSAGLDLPKGKSMVVLSKKLSPVNSYSRTSYWGKYTQITVERAE
jgi:hypothetical protein